jgi:uncharacterized protein YbbC (DUF1343 family)
MIHILDQQKFSPYLLTLALLETTIELYGERFQWKPPPYEYEYEKMPIDLILGNSELRQNLEKGKDLLRLKEDWLFEVNDYREWRKPYLIYD